MKIAILGTRGIPANYGGFETFAEQLAVRLFRRGHQVTVYGRTHYVPAGTRFFDGVRIIRLPALTTKHLETVSHTAISAIDAIFRGYDIALFCNAANAFACWVPRLFGQKVLLNVDGIERTREKWGAAGRLVYRLSERWATWIPNRVISDARTIQDYYRGRFGLTTSFIPYGAPVDRVETTEALQGLGLRPRNYLLYVSRLEPENNAHLVIEAYRLADVDCPLVVVGDAPYSRRYIARLQKMAEGCRILMPGAIYGQGYRELLAHALGYFQATEVGGTHPALLEALGAGCVCIVNDTPENREVAEGCALFCRFSDTQGLAEATRRVVSGGDDLADLPEQARKRVRLRYDWEDVTDQYEALFHELGG